MEYNGSIEITSGVAATEVPEEAATFLNESYQALAKLPSNRQVVIDFPDSKAASEFVRQGKSWANETGLTFARKGTVKENPKRVSFRIYKPRGSAETTSE